MHQSEGMFLYAATLTFAEQFGGHHLQHFLATAQEAGQVADAPIPGGGSHSRRGKRPE